MNRYYLYILVIVPTIIFSMQEETAQPDKKPARVVLPILKVASGSFSSGELSSGRVAPRAVTTFKRLEARRSALERLRLQEPVANKRDSIPDIDGAKIEAMRRPTLEKKPTE